MKKYDFFKKVGLVAILVVMASFVQAKAADMVEANASLAEVATMAAQAQNDLAAAASSGDLDAIAAATQRADAITAALKDATAAVKAMADASDDAAATSAQAALATALQKAVEAYTGQMSGETGGTPKKGSAADNPFPNIYNVLWKSPGFRSVAQGMYTVVNDADSKGGAGYAERYGERDATPE